MPQHAAIDLLSDLTGVETAWRSVHGKKNPGTNWSGWLPHLDLGVAHAFTSASQEHARFFELLKKPGTLQLRAQLDLWSMLHPAVQPGAKLGYEYPPEVVTVVLKSRANIDLKTSLEFKRVSDRELQFTTKPLKNQWLPLEITLPTGGEAPDLEIYWFTDEDPRPRAFPLRRILLPWATPENAQPLQAGPRVIPEIAGGNWARGKEVFFGQRAICFRCHTIAGAGGRIGPDLSNLLYRDYASVLRDITEPSAAINPDHIAYNVQLTDGEMATGVIMQDTPDNLVLGQATGQNLTIPKSHITSMKSSPLSLMPQGLLQALTAQQQKDLLTFLLTAPPENKP